VDNNDDSRPDEVVVVDSTTVVLSLRDLLDVGMFCERSSNTPQKML